MKKLVFDSSSLISLSEKCFVNILGKLAEKKKAEFIIPYSVLEETVITPLKIKRFELNALRIKKAINNDWIKVEKPDKKTQELTQKILNDSQTLCFAEKKPMQIIHHAEIEAIALCRSLVADALVIDERTTRMLLEEPQNLKKLLEMRSGKKVTFDQQKLFAIQQLAARPIIFRSSEILAVGYEKNCFENELEQTKASLKAALYSVKYAGCAITEKEIEDYLKAVR